MDLLACDSKFSNSFKTRQEIVFSSAFHDCRLVKEEWQVIINLLFRIA